MTSGMGLRLKLGRPDLAAFADRFAVPVATGDFGVTFLGVSSLLVDDGESAVLVDGFFSRPSLLRTAVGRLAPDPGRIDAALARLGFGGDRRGLDAVVAGDDLTVTMRVLGDLARAQQVDLHLPTVWRREDPWVDLG